MSSDSSSSVPIYDQDIKSMKKYLDSYGVNHSDCIEKSEIVERVKQTLANPPPKKTQATIGANVVKMLGDKLLSKSGKFNTTALQAKVIALYFSAHWCGPCRSFTPVLRQLYSDSFKQQGVEVVFVSSDQNEAEFSKYYGEMNWLAIPFDERSIKNSLSEQFDIQGIPSLIVLDAATGAVISDDGRRDVMTQKSSAATSWLAKASKPKL